MQETEGGDWGTTCLICGLLLSPGIGCASYAPGSPLLPYSPQTEGKGKASLTPESSPGDYARFTKAAWPGVGAGKGPPPQPSSSPAVLPPQSSPPIPAPALLPTSLEQARPPLQAAVPALVSELELALEQAEVGSVLQGLGQAGLPPAELLLPPGQLQQVALLEVGPTLRGGFGGAQPWEGRQDLPPSQARGE